MPMQITRTLKSGTRTETKRAAIVVVCLAALAWLASHILGCAPLSNSVDPAVVEQMTSDIRSDLSAELAAQVGVMNSTLQMRDQNFDPGTMKLIVWALIVAVVVAAAAYPLCGAMLWQLVRYGKERLKVAKENGK